MVARILNAEGVPTPAQAKAGTPSAHANWRDSYWSTSAVHRTIRDRQYIGSTVFGKHVRPQIGVRRQVLTKLEEWIVVDDRHEPLVSKELFQRAQEALGGEYRQNSRHTKWENPLSKKVICGVCGYAIVRRGTANHYYGCTTPRTVPNMDCFQGKVYESMIMDMVIESIRMYARLAVEAKRLLSVEKEKREVQFHVLRQEQKNLQAVQQQITEESRVLYETFTMERSMSRSEYAEKKTALLERRERAYEAEAEVKRRLEELWIGENRFVEKYEGLTEMDKLTTELSADLLHSVTVWPGGRIDVKLNYLDEIPYVIERELLAAM